MILPVVARSTGVDPGFARPISEWYPTTTTTTKAIRALAWRHQIGALAFSWLGRNGQFCKRLGRDWSTVRKRPRGQSHPDRAVRFSHHLTFSVVIRHLWCWIGAETDATKIQFTIQFTIHLPFWYGLRRPPVWKSEMIR